MGILILVKQHFCIELAHRYMEGCTTGLSLCHKSFRAEFDAWQDILCASNGTQYILSSISKYIISMANIIHGSISLYIVPNWLTTSYDDGLTHDWFKAVINGCICNIAHCTLTLFSSFSVIWYVQLDIYFNFLYIFWNGPLACRLMWFYISSPYIFCKMALWLWIYFWWQPLHSKQSTIIPDVWFALSWAIS